MTFGTTSWPEWKWSPLSNWSGDASSTVWRKLFVQPRQDWLLHPWCSFSHLGLQIGLTVTSVPQRHERKRRNASAMQFQLQWEDLNSANCLARHRCFLPLRSFSNKLLLGSWVSLLEADVKVTCSAYTAHLMVWAMQAEEQYLKCGFMWIWQLKDEGSI
jgi:hypothetical protein